MKYEKLGRKTSNICHKIRSYCGYHMPTGITTWHDDKDTTVTLDYHHDNFQLQIIIAKTTFGKNVTVQKITTTETAVLLEKARLPLNNKAIKKLSNSPLQ